VEFNPDEISFEEILDTYWSSWVAPGAKCQYRSAIWYRNEEQREVAEASLEKARESGNHDPRMLTKSSVSVAPAKVWHDAEKYHQHHLTGGIGKDGTSSRSDDYY